MRDTFGLFTRYDDLTEVERNLVTVAMKAPDRAYCYQSNFPVGSAVLATNEEEMRTFHGCNVENQYLSGSICAERNAVTTAVMEGYPRLLAVAVFCRNYPGGSPCGACRQVLVQFGLGGTLLNICHKDGHVQRGLIDELLPAAKGSVVTSSAQTASERKFVQAAVSARVKSHVPYSKHPRGAVFVGLNASGKRRAFKGSAIENCAYGASVGCENAAMIAARLAGFINQPTLFVTVRDVKAYNPIDGECLQILREFGRDAKIVIVGEDQSIVRTTLVELLPDSFGPEAL